MVSGSTGRSGGEMRRCAKLEEPYLFFYYIYISCVIRFDFYI